MVNRGKKEDGSTALPSGTKKEAERRTTFRNTSPSPSTGRNDKEDAQDPAPKPAKDKPVSGSSCLQTLNAIAPISNTLTRIFEIPESMFMNDKGTSFTSEPGKHAMPMAHALAHGEPLPREIPEYGICIFNKDDNLSCLLVDKRRKVSVFALISDPHGGPESWAGFEKSLSEGISHSVRLQQDRDTFTFVLMEGLKNRKITPENPIQSDECMDILDGIAPLSQELRLQFMMPKTLYKGESPNEFTSDPSKRLDAAALSSCTSAEIPKDLPYYGIMAFKEGEKVLCVLVDQMRKIIVIEEVYEGSTGQGSWRKFENSLRAAADEAAELQIDGRLDHFIVIRKGKKE